MLSFVFEFMAGGIDALSFMTMLCVLTFVTVCCLPVHECAHAWMADKLGDPTGRLSGRINLSPMVHLSLRGTIMLALFGFGYAKPVPVNIRNFKNRKLYFGLTALAGPVSNLIMAVIFIFVAVIISFVTQVAGSDSQQILNIAVKFFTNVGYYNVALAVFNMIPFPPLDGSRILTMILPDKIYYKLLAYEQYMFYVLIGLLFLFNRLGFSPLTIVTEFIYRAIGTAVVNIVSFFAGLFV